MYHFKVKNQLTYRFYYTRKMNKFQNKIVNNLFIKQQHIVFKGNAVV